MRVCIDTNFVRAITLRNFIETKKKACVCECLNPLAATQDRVERLATINYAYPVEMQFGVFRLYPVADGGNPIVKEEEIPVSVTVDCILDTFVDRIAQTKALPNILLKQRPILDAGELDALGKWNHRDYDLGPRQS